MKRKRGMSRIAVVTFTCLLQLLAACAQRIDLAYGGTTHQYDCDTFAPQARSKVEFDGIRDLATELGMRADDEGRVSDAEKIGQMFGMEEDLEREVVKQACESEYPERRTLEFPDSGTLAPGLRLAIVGNSGDAPPFDLDDVRDRYVLVEFWSLGCPPCLTRHPHMAKLARDFAGENVAIVGVAPDAPHRIQEWIRDHGGGEYLQLHDKGDRALREWGVYAIPRMFLLGPGGTVISSCYSCSRGQFSVDSLPAYLRAILGEAGD